MKGIIIALLFAMSSAYVPLAMPFDNEPETFISFHMIDQNGNTIGEAVPLEARNDVLVRTRGQITVMTEEDAEFTFTAFFTRVGGADPVEILDDNDFFWSGTGMFGFAMDFDALGRYELTIYKDEQEFESFVFVAKSADENVFSLNQNMYFIQHNSNSYLTVSFVQNENYIRPAGALLVDIGDLPTGFYARLSGGNILIRRTGNLTIGHEHQILLTLIFQYYRVDDEGKTMTVQTGTQELTINILVTAGPAGIDIWMILLGITVLGGLGGALYGINKMSKRLEERY